MPAQQTLTRATVSLRHPDDAVIVRKRHTAELFDARLKELVDDEANGVVNNLPAPQVTPEDCMETAHDWALPLRDDAAAEFTIAGDSPGKPPAGFVRQPLVHELLAVLRKVVIRDAVLEVLHPAPEARQGVLRKRADGLDHDSVMYHLGPGWLGCTSAERGKPSIIPPSASVPVDRFTHV